MTINSEQLFQFPKTSTWSLSGMTINYASKLATRIDI